ncbi:MAG TPA: F0F1 ATP synthase subunit gamma [Usitatibacter sp.]|nr:F0F1 ATP synthase subunit gamma [Usitatibacter sp.]
MSATRKLDQRLRSLADIGDVMTALKNLALAQVARLRRVAPAQQRVARTVESATADFLDHHPQALGLPRGARTVLLLVGSERGFCGAYNDAVAEAAAKAAKDDPLVVVVGHRLAARLGTRLEPAAVVEGPGFSEEVPAAITRLVNALETLPVPGATLLPALTIASHEAGGGPARVHIRPAFAPPRPARPAFTEPPRLYLDPPAFFRELADHHLFAVLHGMFYDALLAENELRLQHLEGALRRIDEARERLVARRNAMRQEEMTEEIEVILLSAAAASGERAAHL